MHKQILMTLLGITLCASCMHITPRLDWLLANTPTKAFHEFRIDSIADKNTLLRYASCRGYFDAICTLIIHGADAHEYDENILIRAITSRLTSPIARPEKQLPLANSETFRLKRHNLIVFLVAHQAIIDESTIDAALTYEGSNLAKYLLKNTASYQRYSIAARACYRGNDAVTTFMRTTRQCTFKRARFVVPPIVTDDTAIQ